MQTCSSGVSTVSEAFSEVRSASHDELVQRIAWIDEGCVPLGYILPFPIEKRVVLYRFCLLAYYATGGAEVPRENQLKAALASYEGQDSLVIAGTGSGKTLVIALLLLINSVPDRMSTGLMSGVGKVRASVQSMGDTELEWKARDGDI